MDVEHKLGVLDHVHPETQRKAGGRGQMIRQLCGHVCPAAAAAVKVQLSPVAFPSVAHVGVMNPVSVRLLVQEVKHVFDGEG